MYTVRDSSSLISYLRHKYLHNRTHSPDINPANNKVWERDHVRGRDESARFDKLQQRTEAWSVQGALLSHGLHASRWDDKGERKITVRPFQCWTMWTVSRVP